MHDVHIGEIMGNNKGKVAFVGGAIFCKEVMGALINDEQIVLIIVVADSDRFTYTQDALFKRYGNGEFAVAFADRCGWITEDRDSRQGFDALGRLAQALLVHQIGIKWWLTIAQRVGISLNPQKILDPDHPRPDQVMFALQDALKASGRFHLPEPT